MARALIQPAQNYEHLFKVNSPPPPPEKGAKPATAAGKKTLAYYSHYLQSKVVRACERLEAEAKLGEEPVESESEPKAEDSSTPPPPPEQGKSS